jgi:hypothetical protein
VSVEISVVQQMLFHGLPRRKILEAESTLQAGQVLLDDVSLKTGSSGKLDIAAPAKFLLGDLSGISHDLLDVSFQVFLVLVVLAADAARHQILGFRRAKLDDLLLLEPLEAGVAEVVVESSFFCKAGHAFAACYKQLGSRREVSFHVIQQLRHQEGGATADGAVAMLRVVGDGVQVLCFVALKIHFTVSANKAGGESFSLALMIIPAIF